MSKIALLSSTSRAVDEWRASSRIGDVSAALWVLTPMVALSNRPFISVMCLPGWRDHPTNVDLLNYINVLIADDRARSGTGLAIGGTTVGSSELAVFGSPDNAPTPSQEAAEAAAEVAFPSELQVTQQEAALIDFGINPAVLGMLTDMQRNILLTMIDRDQPGARAGIESIARANRIRPWRPRSADSIDGRPTMVMVIESFVGDTYHNDFMQMDPTRLERCVVAARQGNSARQIQAEEIVVAARGLIINLLMESREEYAAGFMSDPVNDPPPVDIDPNRGRINRATPRPYVDPLRDHLRSYMRSEQAEDAERRSERARIRERLARRALGESDPEPEEE